MVTAASAISSVLEETDPPARASACPRQHTCTGGGGLARQPCPSHPTMETREQHTQGRRGRAERREVGRGAQRGGGRGTVLGAPQAAPADRPSPRSVPTARSSAVASCGTQVAASTRGRLARMDCRPAINGRGAAVFTPAHLAFPFATSLYWDSVWQPLFSNHSFFTVKGYFPQAASRDFIV